MAGQDLRLLKTRETATFIKTFPGVEDYAWTTSGVLLMANGSKAVRAEEIGFRVGRTGDFFQRR